MYSIGSLVKHDSKHVTKVVITAIDNISNKVQLTLFHESKEWVAYQTLSEKFCGPALEMAKQIKKLDKDWQWEAITSFWVDVLTFEKMYETYEKREG